MGEWVRLCAINEAPGEGEVTEVEARGQLICLARISGRLHAIDNVCPHREGPMGQGWVEGSRVVCPWHAWAYDATTGLGAEPEQGTIRVFALREKDGELLTDLS